MELSASTAVETDSRAIFLKPLFNTQTPPPAYGALPDTLPVLSVPLPMYTHNFNEVAVQCGDLLQLSTLAKPTADYNLAHIAWVQKSRYFGVEPVAFEAIELLSRPMSLALRCLGQPSFNVHGKSKTTLAQLMPTCSLFLRDVLMFKVEVKNSENDFTQAVFDLQNKMANWQPAYQGRREFMPCCAIAGKRLCFYAVARGGKECKPISREFHMDILLDRLEIIHMALGCVNILLQQLTHQMPMQPVPLGRTVINDETSISYYENHVMKSVNWAAFANNEDEESLEEVYKRIMALPKGAGLNRPRGILSPRKMPEMQGGCWCVEMPLAKRAFPDTEAALKSLVVDALHGLNALHAAGCVHRNVQASNILQVEEGLYALIDFERSGLANGVPRFRALRQWPDECQQEGSIYATSADIYSLGLLVEEYGRLLSPLASEFANMLKRDKPTAEQALQLLWMTC